MSRPRSNALPANSVNRPPQLRQHRIDGLHVLCKLGGRHLREADAAHEGQQLPLPAHHRVRRRGRHQGLGYPLATAQNLRQCLLARLGRIVGGRHGGAGEGPVEDGQPEPARVAAHRLVPQQHLEGEGREPVEGRAGEDLAGAVRTQQGPQPLVQLSRRGLERGELLQTPQRVVHPVVAHWRLRPAAAPGGGGGGGTWGRRLGLAAGGDAGLRQLRQSRQAPLDGHRLELPQLGGARGGQDLRQRGHAEARRQPVDVPRDLSEAACGEAAVKPHLATAALGTGWWGQQLPQRRAEEREECPLPEDLLDVIGRGIAELEHHVGEVAAVQDLVLHGRVPQA
mmetsp:Transcript_49707/g.153511  ORF Transcript_49707/g.153511 Transcript_49707/m.153511 type:complete len:339 (-) Transcript_49707:90-1106(-)